MALRYHRRELYERSGSALERETRHFGGFLLEADEGTRTLDLLHGKQTL
jgi:hypothetical protein